MGRIRVLIAGLPRMLTDIVSAIITSQEDFELAGEAASTAGLAVMAKDAAADVVVLGSPAHPRLPTTSMCSMRDRR